MKTLDFKNILGAFNFGDQIIQMIERGMRREKCHIALFIQRSIQKSELIIWDHNILSVIVVKEQYLKNIAHYVIALYVLIVDVLHS